MTKPLAFCITLLFTPPILKPHSLFIRSMIPLLVRHQPHPIPTHFPTSLIPARHPYIHPLFTSLQPLLSILPSILMPFLSLLYVGMIHSPFHPFLPSTPVTRQAPSNPLMPLSTLSFSTTPSPSFTLPFSFQLLPPPQHQRFHHSCIPHSLLMPNMLQNFLLSLPFNRLPSQLPPYIIHVHVPFALLSQRFTIPVTPHIYRVHHTQSRIIGG